MPENAGKKQGGGRWQKGQSGNPGGKPKGTRNKATEAALALLDGEATKLTRKAIDMALAGDAKALRLCLERITPPRRETPVSLTLPAIKPAGVLPAAIGALLQATAAGEIAPGEAERIARLIGEAGRAIELADIEERLQRLEEQGSKL